MVRLARLRAVR